MNKLPRIDGRQMRKEISVLQPVKLYDLHVTVLFGWEARGGMYMQRADYSTITEHQIALDNRPTTSKREVQMGSNEIQ